jgi:hypothetical protein
MTALIAHEYDWQTSFAVQSLLSLSCGILMFFMPGHYINID